MEVLQRPHALQRNPVLEPQHLLLPSGAQRIDKVRLDKILHLGPALSRQIPRLGISRNWSAGPHNNMRDLRRQAVRPIIQQDLVVRGGIKGDQRFGNEGWHPPGLWQTSLQDVFRYGAILCFGLRGPGNIAAEI